MENTKKENQEKKKETKEHRLKTDDHLEKCEKTLIDLPKEIHSKHRINTEHQTLLELYMESSINKSIKTTHL